MKRKEVMSFPREYFIADLASTAAKLQTSIDIIFDHCIQLGIPLYIKPQDGETVYSVGIKSQTSSGIHVYPKIDRNDFMRHFGSRNQSLGINEIEYLKRSVSVPDDIQLFLIDPKDYPIIQALENIHIYALFESGLKYDRQTYEVSRIDPENANALGLKYVNVLLPVSRDPSHKFSKGSFLSRAYPVNRPLDNQNIDCEEKQQKAQTEILADEPDRYIRGRSFVIYDSNGFSTQIPKLLLHAGRIYIQRRDVDKIQQQLDLIKSGMQTVDNGSIPVSAGSHNHHLSQSQLRKLLENERKLECHSSMMKEIIRVYFFVFNSYCRDSNAVLPSQEDIYSKFKIQKTSGSKVHKHNKSSTTFSATTTGKTAAWIIYKTLENKEKSIRTLPLLAMTEVSRFFYQKCFDFLSKYSEQSVTIFIEQSLIVNRLVECYGFSKTVAEHTATIIRHEDKRLLPEGRPKNDSMSWSDVTAREEKSDLFQNNPKEYDDI
ncbi:MAG: hypothetical protein KGO49_13640 [Gammaproteobacteria bacterium]|nr:hypothetical protein [Gammaproteobacteria bacterium]